MSSDIKIKRLTSTEDPQFRRALAIYKQGFEPLERLEDERLKVLVNKGFYQIWLALDEDDTVLGMGIMVKAKGDPFAWLEFMAVDEDLRSRGIGSRLMEFFIDQAEDREGLLLEVQIPHQAKDPEERHIRNRRIAFYQRHGLLLLDHIPYQMKTAEGGVSMYLMHRPQSGFSPLTGKTLEDTVRFSIKKRREGYGEHKEHMA